MGKTERCLYELDAEKLFHESAHKTRFKELMDVFSEQPFFNANICKCMYLAAWDDEHFLVLLEMLSSMSFGTGTDHDDMTREGEERSDTTNAKDQALYKLSVSFMTNTPYEVPDPAIVDEETMKIIGITLKAAAIIDQLLDK